MQESPPLSRWRWPGQPVARTITQGLINDTFVVSVQRRPVGIIQRLNTDIFAPSVHLDIAAITEHLDRRGVRSPHLLPTIDGDLWWVSEQHQVWRALSYEGDQSYDQIPSPEVAFEAAHAVARFHGAVRDFDLPFHHVRPGAHDTRAHLLALENALAEFPRHSLFPQVRALAQQLFTTAEMLQFPSLPQRVVHGDLKINNVRFENDNAVCLIDLDTMAYGTIDMELGDALRSWCNPGGEDSDHVVFSLDLYRAALDGYFEELARWDSLTRQELSSIPMGVLRVCVELAARFATDSLKESYFGWDPHSYSTRGEHNLHRARGQLALAQDVARQLPQLTSVAKSLPV